MNTIWISIRRRLYRKDIWKNSGLLMLANVIVLGLALIRLPIITRVLSKEEIGMLGIVASMLPFFQLLSFPGIDTASYHYIAKGYSQALWVNISTRTYWSLFSVAACLSVAFYYGIFRNSVLIGWLFVITALTFPFVVGLTNLAGYLAASERFIALFWYRILEAGSRFSGFFLILLLPALHMKVVWFFLVNKGLLAIILILIGLWLYLEMQNAQPTVMPDKVKKEMLAYGKRLTWLNVISVVQTRIDVLYVATLLPLSVIADYAIAQLIYGQFKALWQVYYTVRYPAFARFEFSRRRRRMMIEACIVFFGFALAWVGSVFILQLIIPILFPPEYASSLVMINWLSASFVIGVFGYFAETFFRTLEDEYSQYLLRSISATAAIILPLVLYSFWQVQGILIGRFLASAISSLVGIYLFFNYSRNNLNKSQLSNKPI